MKYLIILLALTFVACDSEQPTDWQQTLAIDSDGRTGWKVIIIADVTKDNPVVMIPDYATEVLLVKNGSGFVRVHSSPDNSDYVLYQQSDTLRIRVK